MPSITTVHESLPCKSFFLHTLTPASAPVQTSHYYFANLPARPPPPPSDVDTEPTPDERAAAEALIAMERSTVPDDPHHALLPPPVQPNFTPFFQPELDRIAASSQDPSSSSNNNNRPNPLRAIDLSRYEAPELPDDNNNPHQQQHLEPALQQAYTSMSYLTSRRQHLALLDTYGKNAWLVGNWQLEAELHALERELADAKRDVDLVTLQRQRAQADAGGEIRNLDETWRRGVGRVLETEVAAEALRRQVLEAERARAQG